VSDTAYRMTASADAEALPVGELGDYIALMKPRVMSLVVFTGLAGMLAAPGHLHWLLASVAVLCIAVAAGASGAINMWYDRDIDAIMERTRDRPLPRGRIVPEEALSFGVILGAGAVMMMGVAVNWVAATLLAVTILYYVFVYTIWLKRRTPQNIVIGGAAGAFPPMIGWAAVTGGVSVGSIALFFLIFMWTPPHFWALSLYRCRDYEAAGVPMLPVVAGKAETKRQMLIYTVLLIPIGMAPALLGIAGWIYGTVAFILGLVFVAAAIAVRRDETDRSAKRMFGFSIFYLFALFALLIADHAFGIVA